MDDLPRFFVPPEALHDGESHLAGEPLHHLRNVLRLKVGAQFILLDGTGRCGLARLARLARDRATVTLLDLWREEERGLPVVILQALPKGDKFDLVLQKGTELGATGFLPVVTARSVPRPLPGRLEKREQRWQKIIREAARQCRRPTLPLLHPVQTLADALETARAQLRLVLWEDGAQPLGSLLPASPPQEVALLVGPEGGFSPAEMTQIRAAGFRPVHLGPRILRTETAGLAVTPVLQYLYGDWSQSPKTEHAPLSEERR